MERTLISSQRSCTLSFLQEVSFQSFGFVLFAADWTGNYELMNQVILFCYLLFFNSIYSSHVTISMLQ